MDDERLAVLIGRQPNAVDPLSVLNDVLASLVLKDRPGNAVGELPRPNDALLVPSP
jgi:hypothetical protein